MTEAIMRKAMIGTDARMAVSISPFYMLSAGF